MNTICRTALVALTALAACGNFQTEPIRLVLRDLTIVETAALTFDEEGVTLGDGQVYGWDQVHSADLHDDRQGEFDRFLQEVGLPLFRIRLRLENRDWIALSQIVEPAYQRQQQQKTRSGASPRVHYLVNLATYYSRLKQGDRPASLVPFLESCRIRNSVAATSLDLPAIDLSAEEVEQYFTLQLLPIWFDESSVAPVLAELTAGQAGTPGEGSDGERIYLASLLIAAGEFDKAAARLQDLSRRTSRIARDWLPILRVQLEIKRGIKGAATDELRRTYRKMAGPLRFVANYLLSLQISENKDDFDAAVLNLLQIPAVHGHDFPALSAAALDQAARISENGGRKEEAKRFKAELSNQYPSTYHGRLLSEENPRPEVK